MNPTELDITVNLIKYYMEEAGESMPQLYEEYDENSIINTLRKFTISPNYVWFNLYEGQRPVGFISGFLVHKPWNENLFDGHIAFVYVLSSHRSLDVFRQLIGQFSDWAKSNNCTRITGGDIGIDEKRTRSIYEQLGFKQILTLAKEISNE
jgi:GNAT superfamily N-acetyltransferase